MLKKAERLLWISLLLRDPHPENVNRNTKLAFFKPCPRVSRGMPSIRANHKITVYFNFAARSFCAHARHAVVLEQEIDNFVFHEQLEIRKSFCVPREEIEKIPLRR